MCNWGKLLNISTPHFLYLSHFILLSHILTQLTGYNVHKIFQINMGWGKSRFTVVSMWNTEFILALLFIDDLLCPYEALQTYFCPILHFIRRFGLIMANICFFSQGVQHRHQQHSKTIQYPGFFTILMIFDSQTVTWQ